MALMTDKHIRHLPVCEGDDLLGLISIGDVVKVMISDREFIIEQLENYITQGG
jgi:CBS domain-containing protein